jgi:hypothetical protein
MVKLSAQPLLVVRLVAKLVFRWVVPLPGWYLPVEKAV